MIVFIVALVYMCSVLMCINFFRHYIKTKPEDLDGFGWIIILVPFVNIGFPAMMLVIDEIIPLITIFIKDLVRER